MNLLSDLKRIGQAVINAGLFPGMDKLMPRPKIKRLIAHPKGEPKPKQATLITTRTAKSMAYLQRRGHADFMACNVLVEPLCVDLQGKRLRLQSIGT